MPRAARRSTAALVALLWCAAGCTAPVTPAGGPASAPSTEAPNVSSAASPASPPTSTTTSSAPVTPVAQPTTPVARDARSTAGVTKTTVTYQGTVGPDRNRSADVYTPPDPGATPAPLVVLVHGGGFVGGDSTEFADIAPVVAARGNVVVVPNYLLAQPGYPVQLDEVVGVVAAFRRRAGEFDLNPQRVALWGSSAGANLSVLAAVTGKVDVRAVVGWSGLYDMTRPGVDELGGIAAYLGCNPTSDPSCRDGVATSASPAHQVEGATTRIRLVNASREVMPTEQLTIMTAALRATGSPVDPVLLDSDQHATAYADSETGPTLDWLTPLLDA